MSWKIKGHTIPHLEHFWQPQDHWELAALEYPRIINDVLRISEVGVPYLDWSVKLDDGLSIKVDNYHGIIRVGYKGKNSPMCFDSSGIIENYADKPYMNTLFEIHRAVEKMPICHGTTVQFGVLYPNSQDRDSSIPKNSLNANVVRYKFANFDPLTKVVMFPVSIQSDDGPILQTRRLLDNIKSFDEVKIVSTSPYFAGFDNADKMFLRSLGADILTQNARCVDRKVFEDVQMAVSEMKVFLNSYIRDGDFFSMVYVFDEFVEFLCKRPKLDLEYIRGKKNSFLSAFQLIDALYAFNHYFSRASYSVKDVDANMNEGLVVSYPSNDGSMVAFKFVDPKFSYANFQKWDDA